jgi:hypothetical protein
MSNVILQLHKGSRKKEIMVIAISNHVEQLKRKKRGNGYYNWSANMVSVFIEILIELNLVELDELQQKKNVKKEVWS